MVELSFHIICVTVFSLAIGSFLGACAYRIPRANSFYLDPDEDTPEETIPKPVPFNTPARSICPHCGTQLLWWHNIPVISWFLLRGKCHFCKAPISFRYPFIELSSTALGLLSYFTYGLTPTGVLIYLICAALLVVTFIDFDHYIIPDVISKNGTYLGIAVSLLNSFFPVFDRPINQNIWELLLGLFFGGGLLWIVAKLYLIVRRRDGLGLGDVKLLFLLGAFCGPECAIVTIFIGSVLGSVLGVVLLIGSRMKLSHYIAFGPYLIMGAYLYLFLGAGSITPFTDLVSIVISR